MSRSTSVTKFCDICSKEFQVKLSRHIKGFGRFCSKDCERIPLEVRFKSKVGPISENECQLWQGALSAKGYGMFNQYGNGCGQKASRVAYLLAYGPFDESMFILHRCDNRRCVNPAHLFLGTNQDNMDDMVAKGRQGKKLTNAQVLEIRRLLACGELSQAAIGVKFGVSQPTIGRIGRGKIWRHLTTPERA